MINVKKQEGVKATRRTNSRNDFKRVKMVLVLYLLILNARPKICSPSFSCLAMLASR